jgi:segregation and condensation protein B
VGASLHDVRAAIEELRLEYVDTGRAFRLEDIAGGVQILTLRAYDPWIRKLRKKQRESRLSPAALEALAVIAYTQPIGKADLDAIRGVNCAPTLKTLLERGLVQVVGRAEGLGRPLLYGTTKRFLESFGISSVRELPQPDSESQAGPRSEKGESPPEREEGRLYPEPEEDAAGLDEDAEDDSESGEERES